MVRADGLPKPEIHWYFNGKPIEEDANHKIETVTEKQVTSKLIITNFDEANTGFVSDLNLSGINVISISNFSIKL